MSWLSLALLLLKIADKILGIVQESKLIDAGADKEIAKASAAILSKTSFAKQTKEKIDGMSRSDLDVLLNDLAKPD